VTVLGLKIEAIDITKKTRAFEEPFHGFFIVYKTENV